MNLAIHIPEKVEPQIEHAFFLVELARAIGWIAPRFFARLLASQVAKIEQGIGLITLKAAPSPSPQKPIVPPELRAVPKRVSHQGNAQSMEAFMAGLHARGEHRIHNMLNSGPGSLVPLQSPLSNLLGLRL